MKKHNTRETRYGKVYIQCCRCKKWKAVEGRDFIVGKKGEPWKSVVKYYFYGGDSTCGNVCHACSASGNYEYNEFNQVSCGLL